MEGIYGEPVITDSNDWAYLALDDFQDVSYYSFVCGKDPEH